MSLWQLKVTVTAIVRIASSPHALLDAGVLHYLIGDDVKKNGARRSLSLIPY